MTLSTWSWWYDHGRQRDWRRLPKRHKINNIDHDDVIKWKHFPRYWPFVRGIHRSPVNSPHKGQWRGALVLSLICVWINGWVNDREAGDLRRYRTHYDIIVMIIIWTCPGSKRLPKENGCIADIFSKSIWYIKLFSVSLFIQIHKILRIKESRLVSFYVYMAWLTFSLVKVEKFSQKWIVSKRNGRSATDRLPTCKQNKSWHSTNGKLMVLHPNLA